MTLFIEIIIGLLILVVLVVAHEWGHARAAIKSGVVVEEFGIGLPPTGWRKKLKNGIDLTLNWLPLGGYVKLKGEYDSADKKGDYGAASFKQKTKILLAGVTVNWIIAIVLLSALSLTGMPRVIENQFSVPSDSHKVSQPVEIVGLTKNHPAANAGIKVGDKIIRFAGKEVPTPAKLIELAKSNKGQEVEVIYTRKGVESVISLTLGDDEKGGYFGANLGQRELIRSKWSVPIVGVATTAQFTWATLEGTGHLFANLFNGLIFQLSSDPSVRKEASSDLNSASESVAGPIGIIGTIFPQAQEAGLTQLVFLTAIISWSLAVMNNLPIPALDDGRWQLMTIYKLRNKKLTKEREDKVQAIGFYVLMSLILLVTIVDVSRII